MIAVTTSIGLQCYEHTDGEVGHNQLVAAADARLYEAKQAGRNRVCAGVFD
jgi:diguanylate cyclase (GGDEF)-like protein